MPVRGGLRGAVLAIVALLTSVLLAPPTAHAIGGPEFCWKDSYGRGVGQVPAACAPGQERIGVLCYGRCGPGMRRVGFDCHSVCPAGMDDQGLFCRRAEYGRGAGYLWQFGNPAFRATGQFERCERDNGAGNCESDGAIVYPKCAPGYSAVGCCICRPSQPDCAALGLNAGIDLSCAKKVAIGSPEVGICGTGEQIDAGLCYPGCQSSFGGVGPVCWAGPPPGWVDCGMGAAKDDATCATTVVGQVASVGQIAMFVATLGTGSSANAAAGGAQGAGRLAKLKAQYQQLKAGWEAIKSVPEVKLGLDFAKQSNRIRQGFNGSATLATAVTEEDMVRAAAQLAAILDPSGVAGVVGSYTYPKCSRYFVE